MTTELLFTRITSLVARFGEVYPSLVTARNQEHKVAHAERLVKLRAELAKRPLDYQGRWVDEQELEEPAFQEADPRITTAYVKLIAAYGAARLGHREHATEVLAHSATFIEDRKTQSKEKVLTLAPTDTWTRPVHAFLVRAYMTRVQHALDGLPIETTPLPPALTDRLVSMDKLERYNANRVREYSAILEPTERVDAIAAFQNVAAAAEPKPETPLAARVREAGARVARGDGEDIASARVVFDEAHAEIVASAERTRAGEGKFDLDLALTHALSNALCHVPVDVAVAYLDALWAGPEIFEAAYDAFCTNGYLSLAAISVVESLVLGYAREDLRWVNAIPKQTPSK